MRRLGLLLSSLAVASFLVGCPLFKKKKTDAVEEDEPVSQAATVTVSGSGAKNEKDVLRYQKEEKLADEPAVVAKDGVKIRSYPGGGADIAPLPKGTAVVKVAKYFSTAFLVLVDDPSGEGKLMGWILPDQLAAPGAVAVTPTTTAPKPVVRLDAGLAAKDAGGPADAGPLPHDAGAGAKDAGAAVVVDAGAPQISGATLFTPAGADGKCPAGFATAPGGCRRPCAADGDCPRTTVCGSFGGKKFCQLK
jgi:hypothetical protein